MPTLLEVKEVIDDGADYPNYKIVKKPLGSKLVINLLKTIDKGLVNGIGEPEPGAMCVEAAVAYTLGENHNDRPQCVNDELCSFKIGLNDDGRWHNDKDRAAGLRRLAIAQLGSNKNFKFSTFEKLLDKRVNAAFVQHWKDKYQSKLDSISASLKKVTSQSDLSKVVDEINNFDNLEYEDLQPFDQVDVGHVSSLSDAFEWSEEKTTHWLAEQAVQVLIEMKVPGTKFLHLTEKKAKAKAKVKAKKRR